MDRTATDPIVGRVLDGRYRVGPRVARGGMATVYEALDLRLDRVCAVKVMHPGLSDDQDFVDRFVREARAAARLSHPNVVVVNDQGDDDGVLFLAMEYVPGRTLRDLLRSDAPLPPSRALALLDPILAALSAAHAAGLVHRDVKPENVLIADDGRIKVADFGLARAVNADTQHTATNGVLIGSVSYLAPELVVEGRSDARCDVYAAGVLLYELLTGRKPHEGDSPIQVAYKHVHEDVPAPSRTVPGVPAYLDALVARATARDRDLRPADARVMLHQVRRVRGALDHGVLEDPELTSDLSPTLPVPRVSGDDDIDYHSEDAPTILTPAQAARAAQDGQLQGGELADPPAAHRRDDTSVLRRSGPAVTRPPGRQPGRQPRRRSRRVTALLLGVLMLAVAAGVAGWWFGTGRYTTTPGLEDLSAAQARQRVAAAGLTYREGDPSYSESVAAGEVLATVPEEGDRVLDGGTVTVMLSLGPERYDVPQVRGLTLDRTRTALRDQRLEPGDVTRRFDRDAAKGTVLRVDPAAGTRVPPGTPVDLLVSKGPRPIPVPDLTGRDAERAATRLGRLGLEVTTTSTNSATVEAGAVISQTPAEGDLVRGDEVELVVSEGPVLVAVPDLTAVGVQAATEQLVALGFEVETAESPTYLGLGFVSSADPEFGARVPEGSTITLFLV